ncbi:MAG: SDR family oxidoreductase [Acidobacteriia bacterium]|nr:SDR family oxidoreductase [Terriglobia bacterium]
MARLAGQVAFITGGGRGIGRAIGLAFAAEGAVVGIADIDRASAEATAADIAKAGGVARAFVIDVSHREAVLDASDRLVSEFGRLDAVVNSAIVFRYEPVGAITEETWNRMTSVGLKSLIWGAQAADRHMVAERGGVIINFSSPTADRGHSGTAVYSAMKGAVGALTRALAVEFGPRGIRVNAISPGAIPTPGARALVDDAGYEMRRKKSPLGRLGTAEEIGEAAVFLASSAGAFITGEVWHVDGGATIMGG